MINVAFVTFANDVVESVRGFHEIEFTNQHVVFRMSETDRNKIIAIRADRVFELITKIEEE
jgi:hypothetical protein